MLGRGWALVAPWLRPLELVIVVIAATEPEGLEMDTQALGQVAGAHPVNVRAALGELATLGLVEYRPARRGGKARIGLIALDEEQAVRLLPALVDRSERLFLPPQDCGNEKVQSQHCRKRVVRARPVLEDGNCSAAAAETAQAHTLLGDLSTTPGHAEDRPIYERFSPNAQARARVNRLTLAACGRLPNDEEWALLEELGELGLTPPLMEVTMRAVLRERPGQVVGSLHYFRPAFLRALGEQARSELLDGERRSAAAGAVSGGSGASSGAAGETGQPAAGGRAGSPGTREAGDERWRRWTEASERRAPDARQARRAHL
jgi:hypothetical protein